MKPRGMRKSEKGQTTLEFILVFPLILAFFLLILGLAAAWHGMAVDAHLALEAASRDDPAFASDKAQVLVPSFGLSASTSAFDGGEEWGEGRRYTMAGQISIDWLPFGLSLSSPALSSVTAPVWEFQP